MCPNVTKIEVPLVDCDEEGRVTYMDNEGEYNDTLVLDTSSDLYKKIKEDLSNENNSLLISIVSAMNKS